MRHTKMFAAFGMIAAISPAIAAQPEATPQEGAPAATADARYCLRVEPITGSRIEMILCETRQEWSLLGVDVDREWAKEGVRVIS
jgi:hypothetical protein